MSLQLRTIEPNVSAVEAAKKFAEYLSITELLASNPPPPSFLPLFLLFIPRSHVFFFLPLQNIESKKLSITGCLASRLRFRGCWMYMSGDKSSGKEMEREVERDSKEIRLSAKGNFLIILVIIVCLKLSKDGKDFDKSNYK